VVVLHHEQPIVSLRLLVRAGSATDPHDKEGLASLLASLLDQGTTKLSAHQIADQIDSVGGELGAGTSSDLTFASVVVMKDSFGAGLDLLSDVVRHPAFDADEIERQREQTLSGLKVSNQDPD
jgi:zinc protease